MRDFVVVAIVLGMVPIVLAKPHVGILLWSWLGYMNPHKLAWGWARDFPLAEIAAIATFVGLVFSREPKRFSLNGVTCIWLVLTTWFTVTTVTAFNSEAAWEQWEKVAKIQLVALLTLVLINNRQRLGQLVWIIVLSLGFFGVKGGLYVIRSGGDTGRVWGPPGGFIEGNNELALALLMVLPLMFFLWRREERPLLRYLLIGMICLTVVSVLGSFSRGAFLGLLACGVFLMLKSQRRVPVAIAVAVAAFTMAVIMPQSWWDRMGTIQTYQEDSSAQGRLGAWSLATKVANANPLGAGFDFWSPEVYEAYGVDFVKAQDAHSIYFEVLGEHGWLGLVLFVSLLTATWRCGSRLIRSTTGQPELEWERDLVRMSQVSLVAYAVGGAFLGLAYFDLPYHVVGIVVIMSTYVRMAGQSGAVVRA